MAKAKVSPEAPETQETLITPELPTQETPELSEPTETLETLPVTPVTPEPLDMNIGTEKTYETPPLTATIARLSVTRPATGKPAKPKKVETLKGGTVVRHY